MAGIAHYLHFVMLFLGTAAFGFTLVHTALAGIAIMGSHPQKKEEAAGRIKWIVVGAVIAFSSYVIAGVSGHVAAVIEPSISGKALSGSAVNAGTMELPGMGSHWGMGGWVESLIFNTLSDLLNMFAIVFWTLVGFQGPTSMALANVQSATNTNVMGIFSPTTWSAMMYVQHAFYFVIAFAAVISFSMQGINIQNAPSSAIAKERLMTLIKNVIVAGILLGGTPYLLGLLNSGVEVFSNYITHMITVHTALLDNSGTITQTIFGRVPLSPSLFTKFELFSGQSLANAFFNLLLSVVNLIMWVVYQMRRITLALMITFMPLFYLGLVTGKNASLVTHWWKEIISYLLIPVTAMLFLLVAQVFLGI